MVNRILALCAILLAALFAASGVLGCDQDNGQNTTDYGPADTPEDVTKTSDSVATETTEEVEPDPCTDWAPREGQKYICGNESFSESCVLTFWVEEWDGVDYCYTGCGDSHLFTGYVGNILWDVPTTGDFTVEAISHTFTCNREGM